MKAYKATSRQYKKRQELQPQVFDTVSILIYFAIWAEAAKGRKLLHIDTQHNEGDPYSLRSTADAAAILAKFVNNEGRQADGPCQNRLKSDTLFFYIRTCGV